MSVSACVSGYACEWVKEWVECKWVSEWVRVRVSQNYWEYDVMRVSDEWECEWVRMWRLILAPPSPKGKAPPPPDTYITCAYAWSLHYLPPSPRPLPGRWLLSSTHIKQPRHGTYVRINNSRVAYRQVATVARSPPLTRLRISDSRSAWQTFEWILEVDGRLMAVNTCDINLPCQRYAETWTLAVVYT